MVLIPKNGDPQGLHDFRHINLVGCITKVISKVLANRLKSVISSVISEEQLAYVSGRCILDGPLILNEVISWTRRSKDPSLLFKIDFEKAFDSVDWNFICDVLKQMGFPDG